MKFNIYGFNQEMLVDKYNELNGNDVIVLRTMVDIIPRMTRTVVVEGKEYKQVSYELLLEDIPFVTQSVSTLKKIVQKLINAGLLERHLVNKGGKFTYFRTTELLKELEYVGEVKAPVDSNGKAPVDGQVHFTEVANEEIDEEAKADYELRIEQIESVLDTRATREIKSLLAEFKNQEEFFKYFDNYILPMKEEGKINKCSYMAKNLRMFFEGKLN
ncbi:MAG: hypothetical protein MR510_00190 [Clostridium sp.]|uniref:hypothetical protein n=1 Tax=Clostridium sp. TaxID=1506 RepID=UPI002A759078|nr:hypothetical protein [Clostridium sp.]MCI6690896.1 hypothetical protein [Clostridium sp.]MDY2632602.1 hypothetical protein [Clostridium sp.]MDY4253259.1 hypothetical protein [Clostridium sp.]